MRDLNYALKQLCIRNRDGSFGTQAKRERLLNQIAEQLEDMGFRHMDAHSLKPKHVEKLVERWLVEKLAPGTIKNRMAALRWWAQKSARRTSSLGAMPPMPLPIVCSSPTLAKRPIWIPASSAASTTPEFASRCACRRCSVCAARNRSRSSQPGRIAAT